MTTTVAGAMFGTIRRKPGGLTMRSSRAGRAVAKVAIFRPPTSPTPSSSTAQASLCIDHCVDALEEQLLRALAEGGHLTADELARRIRARHWADLSTALTHLAASGYVTVVGPLGRAETRYRAHPQGLAALDRPT